MSNRVLEDAGVSKRYNLGTYESMGIDLEPLKHINSRTFNKERKGELTEEGPVLARRQWDNVHDRMVKEHEARARRRQASIEAMGDHAARLVAPQAYAAHRVAEVRMLPMRPTERELATRDGGHAPADVCLRSQTPERSSSPKWAKMVLEVSVQVLTTRLDRPSLVESRMTEFGSAMS